VNEVGEVVALPPVRPSAYSWYAVNRACSFAFFGTLAVSLVAILAFRQEWVIIILFGVAVSSQLAHIAGLVQRRRELSHGYTTIPWLAVHVELRDPAEGRVLVEASMSHPSFTSLKQARTFAVAIPAPPSAINEVGRARLEGYADSRPKDSIQSLIVHPVGLKRIRARYSAAAIILFALIGVALSFAGHASALPLRWAWFTVGFGLAVACLLVTAGFASSVNSRWRTGQVAALSSLGTVVTVVAVRSTVELFGEIQRADIGKVGSKLSLVVGPTEIALWVGNRSISKVFSASRASVDSVRSLRAHDIRGNEKPAVFIECAESRHVTLFVQRAGSGSLFFSSESETELAVNEIKASLTKIGKDSDNPHL
jgi:hypothetical protein